MATLDLTRIRRWPRKALGSPRARGRRGLVGILRSHLGNSAHLWVWDQLSLMRKVKETGFRATRRCAFGDCEDPAFREVESESRFAEEASNIRELAIECQRPS